MSANFPFETNDTSGAIGRRTVSIIITRIPATSKTLLSTTGRFKVSTTGHSRAQFKGDLLEELGAIAYWGSYDAT